MTFAHFSLRDGTQLQWFATISIFTVAVLVAGYFALPRLRRPALVEALTLGLDLLVLLNVLVAIELDFDPAKLSYFVVMAMIFAFAGASLRQTLPAILLAMAALFVETYRHAPELAAAYGFVGFASAISSLSIATFLRKSLLTAALDRIEAEARHEDARRLAEEAHARARTDSLTGLPNRRDFFDTVAQRLRVENLDLRGGGFWLVLLDLDGFKGVNDNFGHMTGDGLLREVAHRLERFGGHRISAARLGGDEFGLMLDMQDDAAVQAWCDALVADLGRPYEIESNIIRITASVGCKRSRPGDTARTLLEHADYALLYAKRRRASATIFSEEHANEMERHFRIDQSVREPDFAAKLRIHFQPLVDLRTTAIVGAEALLRWHHPDLGHISPERLVSAAEDAGLVSDITLHVLERSLRAASAWPSALMLSVNLSHLDIMSETAVQRLIEVAGRSPFPPGLLTFEITENALIFDTETATANLRRLASAGHRIALDDFGTGYANYDVLRRLPIHRIKLDRSLVTSPADPVARELARSIAALGSILGLGTTVEGIETQAQFDLARTIGADHGQGFLFGRPMPQGKFLQRLHQQDLPENGQGGLRRAEVNR